MLLGLNIGTACYFLLPFLGFRALLTPAASLTISCLLPIANLAIVGSIPRNRRRLLRRSVIVLNVILLFAILIIAIHFLFPGLLPETEIRDTAELGDVTLKSPSVIVIVAGLSLFVVFPSVVILTPLFAFLQLNRRRLDDPLQSKQVPLNHTSSTGE